MGGIDFLRQVAMGEKPAIGDRWLWWAAATPPWMPARTAVRLGAKEVYVVYRRTEAEMPAEQLEIDEAREEGVIYKFLTNPAEIIGENGRVKEIKLQVMELGEPDESGPPAVRCLWKGSLKPCRLPVSSAPLDKRPTWRALRGLNSTGKALFRRMRPVIGPLCQGFSLWEMPQTKGRPLPLRPLARPPLRQGGGPVPQRHAGTLSEDLSLGEEGVSEYFADYIKLPRAKSPPVPRRSGSTTFRRSIWASPRPRPGRKRPAVWTAAAMILPNVS